MSTRRGKVSEREWYRGKEYAAKRYTFMHARFYDVSDYIGRRCPTCKREIKKCAYCGNALPITHVMPPKQISDFWTLYRGRFIAEEVKSSTHKKVYLRGYIRPHQIHSLLTVEQNGGIGVLVFNKRVRGDNHYYVVRIKDFVEGTASEGNAIPWDVIKDIAFVTVERKKDMKGNFYADYSAFLSRIS